jgi:hypothetical protein
MEQRLHSEIDRVARRYPPDVVAAVFRNYAHHVMRLGAAEATRSCGVPEHIARGLLEALAVEGR